MMVWWCTCWIICADTFFKKSSNHYSKFLIVFYESTELITIVTKFLIFKKSLNLVLYHFKALVVKLS